MEKLKILNELRRSPLCTVYNGLYNEEQVMIKIYNISALGISEQEKVEKEV